MARIQVRNDSSQPDVRTKPTTPMMKKKHLERPKILQEEMIIVRTPRQAAQPSVCQSFLRLKFDSFDHYRNIPSRKHMIDGGYSAYLDQQAATPPTRDEKREDLENIAQTTREQLTRSKIRSLNIHETPEKSILKRRYPHRSNKGQPGPSSHVSCAKFQLNMYDTHQKDSIDLPQNVHFSGVTFSANQMQILDNVYPLT